MYQNLTQNSHNTTLSDHQLNQLINYAIANAPTQVVPMPMPWYDNTQGDTDC